MVFLHTIKAGRGIVNQISTVPSSEWFRTRPDFKMSVFCIPFIKQKQKKRKKERKEKKKKEKKKTWPVARWQVLTLRRHRPTFRPAVKIGPDTSFTRDGYASKF